MTAQRDLFADEYPLVPGLSTLADIVSARQEMELSHRIDAAPLEPFKFGHWTGKRMTAHYGSAYDYQRARVTAAPPLPGWLLGLRTLVSGRAGMDPDTLQQALLIRYDPGAAIGWHRDRPQYGEVVGLSLGAPATLRLRRRTGNGFERRSLPLEPRSAYILSGEVREDWEHSIAPLEETRWSITFRTLR